MAMTLALVEWRGVLQRCIRPLDVVSFCFHPEKEGVFFQSFPSPASTAKWLSCLMHDVQSNKRDLQLYSAE